MHAMAKCDPFHSTTVFRGVMDSKLYDEYPIGRKVTWYQLNHCSYDRSMINNTADGSGPRTVFTIQLTTGRARDISKFSLIPMEQEVLLPPNCRFEGVIRHLDAGNDIFIKSNRGGGLPVAHAPFFNVGKKFRVPLYLATSFDEDVSCRRAVWLTHCTCASHFVAM
jgi:hypothetical protein